MLLGKYTLLTTSGTTGTRGLFVLDDSQARRCGLHDLEQVDPGVRLQATPGADPDRVWQAVCSDVTRLLAEHNLGHVMVARAEEPPEQATGGKYREIISLG